MPIFLLNVLVMTGAIIVRVSARRFEKVSIPEIFCRVAFFAFFVCAAVTAASVRVDDYVAAFLFELAADV